MKRDVTGRYVRPLLRPEPFEAFVPARLPPDPPLHSDDELQSLRDHAHLALGRLDGLSTLLPDPSYILYLYVRKEAVLSSQIEGTQSSLSDLLLYETDQAPGVPLDDVREVSRYVAALDHGLARLREGFPLSFACSARSTVSCWPAAGAAKRCRASFERARTGSVGRAQGMRCSCPRRRTKS
jgi:hypothetical protein